MHQRSKPDQPGIHAVLLPMIDESETERHEYPKTKRQKKPECNRMQKYGKFKLHGRYCTPKWFEVGYRSSTSTKPANRLAGLVLCGPGGKFGFNSHSSVGEFGLTTGSPSLEARDMLRRSIPHARQAVALLQVKTALRSLWSNSNLCSNFLRGSTLNQSSLADSALSLPPLRSGLRLEDSAFPPPPRRFSSLICFARGIFS